MLALIDKKCKTQFWSFYRLLQTTQHDATQNYFSTESITHACVCVCVCLPTIRLGKPTFGQTSWSQEKKKRTILDKIINLFCCPHTHVHCEKVANQMFFFETRETIFLSCWIYVMLVFAKVEYLQRVQSIPIDTNYSSNLFRIDTATKVW